MCWISEKRRAAVLGPLIRTLLRWLLKMETWYPTHANYRRRQGPSGYMSGILSPYCPECLVMSPEFFLSPKCEIASAAGRIDVEVEIICRCRSWRVFITQDPSVGCERRYKYNAWPVSGCSTVLFHSLHVIHALCTRTTQRHWWHFLHCFFDSLRLWAILTNNKYNTILPCSPCGHKEFSKWGERRGPACC
jgi:hypothetical protein